MLPNAHFQQKHAMISLCRRYNDITVIEGAQPVTSPMCRQFCFVCFVLLLVGLFVLFWGAGVGWRGQYAQCTLALMRVAMMKGNTFLLETNCCTRPKTRGRHWKYSHDKCYGNSTLVSLLVISVY